MFSKLPSAIYIGVLKFYHFYRHKFIVFKYFCCQFEFVHLRTLIYFCFSCLCEIETLFYCKYCPLALSKYCCSSLLFKY